jgi:hypothetical protein
MSAAADYRALAKRYRHLPELVVRAGAAEIQRSVLVRLDRDTGGDRVLSGTVRRGRRTKLGVSVTVSPGRNFASATVKPSPPKAGSFWSWLENGTGERVVGELTRKTSGPGGKHMKMGSAWRTGPWSAGRMPAKHTFTEGSARGIPDAERAMAAVFEKAGQ